jgi:hypothetical protein
MAMKTVFPPKSMGKVVIIPYGWNICPSKDFKSVAGVSSLGEPRDFQQEIDMMQVEAPSSTTVLVDVSP